MPLEKGAGLVRPPKTWGEFFSQLPAKLRASRISIGTARVRPLTPALPEPGVRWYRRLEDFGRLMACVEPAPHTEMLVGVNSGCPIRGRLLEHSRRLLRNQPGIGFRPGFRSGFAWHDALRSSGRSCRHNRLKRHLPKTVTIGFEVCIREHRGAGWLAAKRRANCRSEPPATARVRAK
jgi:hypothetical protein